MKNFYAVLEATPTASVEEIRQSYRRLAQEKVRDEAAFSELMEAYEALSNPTRRAEYDRQMFGSGFTPGAADMDVMTALVPVTMAASATPVCPLAAGMQCPVLNAPAPLGETYCPECGVALDALPGLSAADTPAALDVTTQIRFEEQTGRPHLLRPGLNSVGREGADVLLPDKSISRQHAQVNVTREGLVFLEDLGSTNGTRVSGETLSPQTPRALADGDLVRFGSVSVTTRIPLSARPVASTPSIVERTAVFEERTAVFNTMPLLDLPAEPTLLPGDALAAPSLPESALPVARLVSQDATPPRIFALFSGVTTIGRRAENAIALADDKYVSGRHALVEITDEAATITDVGSSNGTSVNGTPLTANAPQKLTFGDKITLGETHYRFEAAPGNALDEE